MCENCAISKREPRKFALMRTKSCPIRLLFLVSCITKSTVKLLHKFSKCRVLPSSVWLQWQETQRIDERICPLLLGLEPIKPGSLPIRVQRLESSKWIRSFGGKDKCEWEKLFKIGEKLKLSSLIPNSITMRYSSITIWWWLWYHVLTNIHRQTREKTEWKTRGGEATECFARGFFSSLEWIFEILLSKAQHIAIIPCFLVATTNSDEYGQISNTSLSTVAPKNVE